MSEVVALRYKGAFPIGDTDVNAIPVKKIGPAVGYYVHVLGFGVESREGARAVLRRDDAVIGIEENAADPEQASVYFPVSDAEAARAELASKGIEPSELSFDEHGGKRLRIFFAREPYGVCFCFGEEIAPSPSEGRA